MTVLAAIVFLFVGFVLAWAIRSREIEVIVEARDRWIAGLVKEKNQARQVAQVERDRKTLVEGQRSRLARLLRQYDRCECGMTRAEHGPDGMAMAYGRCTGFRLKTPADPLETVMGDMTVGEICDNLKAAPDGKIAPLPRSASELADVEIAKLPDGVSPVAFAKTISNFLEPFRPQLGAIGRSAFKAEYERMARELTEGIAENSDEPGDCEIIKVPDSTKEALERFAERQLKPRENREEPPAECCSEGDAGEKFGASVHRSLNGAAGLH
jgi:hypothetical protein